MFAFEAESGTLYLDGDRIRQVASNTLSAGAWNALNGATLKFLDGTSIATTNAATINLADSGENITGLSGYIAKSRALRRLRREIEGLTD